VLVTEFVEGGPVISARRCTAGTGRRLSEAVARKFFRDAVQARPSVWLAGWLPACTALSLACVCLSGCLSVCLSDWLAGWLPACTALSPDFGLACVCPAPCGLDVMRTETWLAFQGAVCAWVNTF
jgi:hypothetical protein